METNSEFGELLIGALKEAVAYKQGKLPDLRMDRPEAPVPDKDSSVGAQAFVRDRGFGAAPSSE
jgi:hypothetical protein